MQTERVANAIPRIRRAPVSTPAKPASGKEHRRGKSSAPKTKQQFQTNLKLILLGDSKRASAVEFVLSTLSVDIARVSSVIDAIAEVDTRTIGFVVVAPVAKQSITKICKTLIEVGSAQELPVLAVVSDRCGTKVERSLYRIGAEAVFEYPGERRELPRLVMEALGLRLKTQPGAESDRAICDTLRRRLKADSEVFGRNIKVACSDGIVSLSGTLDAYWKMKYLERLVAQTSNVRAVIISGLALKVKKQSDKKLEKNIRELIKVSSSLSSTTLDISVSQGEVELRGSTKDGLELQRLEELISQMKAVRSVKATVVVSPEQAKRDSSTAASISRFFSTLYPKGNIKISVFGGIVVLRGRVKNLSDVLEAANAAKRKAGVRKVVNKLRVQIAATA